MPSDPKAAPDLAPGARTLVDAVRLFYKESRHTEPCVHHWLAVVLERHGPMAESLVKGIDVSAMRRSLAEKLAQGETGAALSEESLLEAARQVSVSKGKALVAERDVTQAVLLAAGYSVEGDGSPVVVTPLASSTPASSSASSSSVQAPARLQASSAWAPRNSAPTPTLDQFGQDLTKMAANGQLAPFVGREEEITLALETLCRRTKRNPILVGPPGVGKTAIVEGIAQRIVAGAVPVLLRGMRLIALQPSSIVAGSSMVGELEKRMTALLAEARLDGILLFIDEVHAIIGAGGSAGRSDIASQLKPSLARGDFPCLAATTDEEFRRHIEADGALERRFQPVRVQELSPEATLLVLKALKESLEKLRNVTVPDSVLAWLVEFAGSNLKNRFFPDKAVDLLEQCVAHAVANSKAEADMEVARLVARRLAGLPVSPEERLGTLSKILTVRNLLLPDDLERLMARLQVTVRGLDLRPNRPNAVVLCAGEFAEAAPALGSAVAEGLFGSPERVVAVDFARFTHHTDITLLLGAPPAYVGYNEDLPVHGFLQMPWSVFLCENVDACHPSILRVLSEALGSGFFTDSTGRRIYLSDAVVICSAPGIEPSGGPSRAIGFGSAARVEEDVEGGMAKICEEALGFEFASNCDLVLFRPPAAADLDANLDTARRLLDELTLRYRTHGVDINWQEGVAAWLCGKAHGTMNAAAWERLIDRYVAPALVAHLPRPGEGHGVRLVVTVDAESLHVDKTAAEPAADDVEKNERRS